jgi:hypothetical protein
VDGSDWASVFDQGPPDQAGWPLIERRITASGWRPTQRDCSRDLSLTDRDNDPPAPPAAGVAGGSSEPTAGRQMAILGPARDVA